MREQIEPLLLQIGLLSIPWRCTIVVRANRHVVALTQGTVIAQAQRHVPGLRA
jgi:hypothetical protein